MLATADIRCWLQLRLPSLYRLIHSTFLFSCPDRFIFVWLWVVTCKSPPASYSQILPWQVIRCYSLTFTVGSLWSFLEQDWEYIYTVITFRKSSANKRAGISIHNTGCAVCAAILHVYGLAGWAAVEPRPALVAKDFLNVTVYCVLAMACKRYSQAPLAL